MTNNDSTQRSIWEVIQACSGTEQDRKNSRRFALWCLAWAVAYVAAHKIMKSNMDLAIEVTWLLVATPIVLMVVAVFSYLNFLRRADELLQKIQLQGLAMGFGAGVVFVTGYQLLEAAGVQEMQTDHLIVVMMFSWAGGQLLGSWRYR